MQSHHGFIQWLFPNTEDYGVNAYAERLTKEEAEAIRNDPVMKARVLKSFHLMLDFWGMKLGKCGHYVVIRYVANVILFALCLHTFIHI